MNMIPVTSTNIKTIGYDPAARTLRVQFNSGGTYDYTEVPEATWHDFAASASKGQFFVKEIKGKYQSTKTGISVEQAG